MRIVADFQETAPFEVIEPEAQCVPFVFNSPHSGATYPADFLASSRLNAQAIRRSEDCFVDALFEPVVGLGAPLMRAHFPRAFLDLNREPYELDPAMFDGALPPYVNSRSVRVAGGLGTIARVVADAEEIYAFRLPVIEAVNRIERLYKPYHTTLARLIGRTYARFGVAVLIDCHSMPSSERAGDGRRRPDMVVGDRYGTSAAPGLTDAVIALLSGLGYSVSRNRPYAGGYITEHYGRPLKGLHAIQIEINRSLYMDERLLKPSRGFGRLSRDLATFAEALFPFVPAAGGALPLAAE